MDVLGWMIRFPPVQQSRYFLETFSENFLEYFNGNRPRPPRAQTGQQKIAGVEIESKEY